MLSMHISSHLLFILVLFVVNYSSFIQIAFIFFFLKSVLFTLEFLVKGNSHKSRKKLKLQFEQPWYRIKIL